MGSRRPAGSWTPLPTSRCSCSRCPTTTTRSSLRSAPARAGYLLKGAQRAELIRVGAGRGRGRRDLRSGRGATADGLLLTTRARPVADAAFPELTDREREILELVAQGRSNAEITAHLVLSPKTVRNHVSNIFSKLQVRDRAEAIVRAREAGMGGEAAAGGRDARSGPPSR